MFRGSLLSLRVSIISVVQAQMTKRGHGEPRKLGTVHAGSGI